MRPCVLFVTIATLCGAAHIASATTTTQDNAAPDKHPTHHAAKTSHTEKGGHTEKRGHAAKARAKFDPHTARTPTAEHDKTTPKPVAKHGATPTAAAKPKAPISAAASATAAEAASKPPATAATPPAPPADDTPKGSATGLPLPRFASLRSDDVNFRTGPGTRYPIDWVYKRRDLPVEIEREFEVWRLVRAPDGTKDWVHQATLTGRRDVIVTGVERTLRSEASTTSAPVAKLQDGVILRVKSCDAKSAWCRVQAGDYRGWIRRDEVWGLEPDEAIGN